MQVTDITNHADLIFQDVAFTADFSYIATIPYTNVNPTITDFMSQISAFNGKQECTLVG